MKLVASVVVKVTSVHQKLVEILLARRRCRALLKEETK